MLIFIDNEIIDSIFPICVDFNQDDVNSEASHQHNGYRDHHRQQHQQQQQQQQQQPMNRLGSGSGSTQSSNRSQVASSHMNQLSHPNSSNQRKRLHCLYLHHVH